MSWKLKSLTVSDADRQAIAQEWYQAQPEDVRAAFETRMKFLVEREEWDRPYVGRLRKECKGLIEIILKVNGVQYRPIGYISGSQEFTFLAFATERDGKFDPLNICQTAFNRMAIAKFRKERVREIRF